MCRYAYSGPYKEKWACFNCRKMFRKPVEQEMCEPLENTTKIRRVICPDCDKPMHNMGRDFKPPRQANKAQWKKVLALYAHGYAFHSCGCGPGERPKRLSEVADFLEERKKPLVHSSGKAQRNSESALDRQRLDEWRAANREAV